MIDLVEEFEKKIRKEEIKRVHIRKEKGKEKALNLEAEVFKKSDLPEKYIARIIFK